MKLTGNIVLAFLEKEGAVASSHAAESAGWLEGTLLPVPGDRIRPGWIYLIGPVTAGKLQGEGAIQALPSQALFVFCEGMEPPDGLLSGSHIVIKKEYAAAQVLNLLSRAFSFYEAWEEKLQDIQYHFGSAAQMLELSEPVLENPLVVLDENLMTVACSRMDLLQHYGFLAGGDERMELVNAMLQDTMYRKMRESLKWYWGPDYITGVRMLNWNVRRSGDTQYCLSLVEHDRTLTDADGDLLQILGFHIKFALYHHSGGNLVREGQRKLLHQILSDRTLDYAKASRLLSENGWHSEHSYLCLVYRLTYLDREVLPTASICNYMEERYPNCCSFPFQDDIVTFFDLTRERLQEEEIQTQLKPFIRDSYLKAGFSRSMKGHMNLRRQYVQSALALDVGGRRNPYQWIHYFDQIAVYHIYERITGKLPAEMLVHKGLLTLREMDRTNGTEYAKTLKVYLDRQMNAVQSARDLFIHRSTFLYRMDRIREILESDLTDPEELLYLNLSYRLLMEGTDE